MGGDGLGNQYTNLTQLCQGIDKRRGRTHNQHGAEVEYWINAVLAKYHYVLYRRYEVPRRRLT